MKGEQKRKEEEVEKGSMCQNEWDRSAKKKRERKEHFKGEGTYRY